MTTATKIRAAELTRHFDAVHAVNGIEIDVEEGQIFGFLGPNGSGKTTTIRMLTTLLPPTSGSIAIDGIDALRAPSEVRRRIGVALQEAGLDDLQTGRELLSLQAHLCEVPTREVQRRVNDLLEVVELSEAADRRIKTYSGGMQRRLDLASALIHGPRIIFLDEPTTGLDPASRDSLWRYVERLNQDEGVTFFLTTQYLEEADALAHEVAIIDQGQIVAQGSPDALKDSVGADVVTIGLHGETEHSEELHRSLTAIANVEDVRDVDDTIVVYVRDGAAAIAPIVLAMREAGIEVRDVSLKEPTLDDVFLRKTGHHLEPDAATEDGVVANGAGA